MIRHVIATVAKSVFNILNPRLFLAQEAFPAGDQSKLVRNEPRMNVAPSSRCGWTSGNLYILGALSWWVGADGDGGLHSRRRPGRLRRPSPIREWRGRSLFVQPGRLPSRFVRHARGRVQSVSATLATAATLMRRPVTRSATDGLRLIATGEVG
jgi:hypothetical protein